MKMGELLFKIIKCDKFLQSFVQICVYEISPSPSGDINSSASV